MDPSANDNQTFQEASYKKHQEWHNTHFPTDQVKVEFFQNNIPEERNVANWLQELFFACLDPILKTKKQTWLTVGDAYGFDAHYILSKSDHEVMASDLNEEFLRVAQTMGIITNFSCENAEKLSFNDNSFDFVLCKEAYHHFPRPYAALYEMMRVAKKGIVIIEPQDPITKIPLLLAMVNIISKFSQSLIKRVWKNRFSFEPVGNFVYKVSEREFEKFGGGLGLNVIAFKQINPNFHTGGLQKVGVNFSESKFRNISIKKGILDFATKVGLLPGQVLATIVFKQKPTPVEIEDLKKSGYKIVTIPDNPYQ